MEQRETSHYSGLLCIGDPHLASRAPGFRRDDYPRAVLGKLSWALAYAREHQLLPTILGDLFHWPRENSNGMLVELLKLFSDTVLCIAGNHDSKENELADDDTLSILWAAGRLRLLERSGPWHGNMGGRSVVVGGTAWGQRLPMHFDRAEAAAVGENSLVIWLAHHDVRFPGYEEVGRFAPHEIPGVDILVNGHIHRSLPDVIVGMTTWINPGNIARIKRTDADRKRRPRVLRIDVRREGWEQQWVDLPFRSSDEVFHEEAVVEDLTSGESMFVRGLATLESFKTHGGAGLRDFLEQNLAQFDPEVAMEIRALAKEVCVDGV